MVQKSYAVCFPHSSRNTVREYIFGKERYRIYFIEDQFLERSGGLKGYSKERATCIFSYEMEYLVVKGRDATDGRQEK